MPGNPTRLFKLFQPIGPTTLESLADWLNNPPADPEVSAPRPLGRWRVASLLSPSWPPRQPLSVLRKQIHAPWCLLASHRYPVRSRCHHVGAPGCCEAPGAAGGHRPAGAAAAALAPA